jgi:ABC-type sugar transport system substrate-binding protein
VGDQTGKWDATVAQTTFEQLYNQNGGKVDGVVSANDTMAGGIVTVLNNNNLAGKRDRVQGCQPGGRGRREAGDRDRQERRLGRRPGQRRGR